ncbi:hypothetical protein [Bacillus badius]|nr:hypothetical protein [Bacillus badius]KZN99699.1 hypothetical protein A4244_17025 [Bacillus badius]KZR58886.1 hypothetical protein A3781_15200 [Bacillus badius]MED0666486.1 hypothetical protein [Bacillus badius]MED4715633.1 hypothetical protein [Bacillus badius]OCS85804.1 hypothetical protein A6M11_17040 [Bacillus badius]
MNTSSMLRSYLSKMMDPESYFYHVVNCIEVQLHDWEQEAILLFDWSGQKETIYLSFFIDDQLYPFSIEKEEAEKLQEKSPYALDRYMWEALMKQGFVLQKSNYIHLAFSVT